MIFAKICIMQWPSDDLFRPASNSPTGLIVKCTPNKAGRISDSTSVLHVTNVTAESKSGERSRK